ncbi:hypothetical protein SCLCIDRAFT_1210471 [Scleroderma citrinum Foug A]|uniref:Uncharacterized protein n=1 Tax=Scleroderma citrinum Foug A TaxID=1036808 RepID=A0A0C3A030_9AGAM|nr:hypothetical protein SCLCIDRAFT_1210471 [Scleroderma citrinum Foug A]
MSADSVASLRWRIAMQYFESKMSILVHNRLAMWWTRRRTTNRSFDSYLYRESVRLRFLRRHLGTIQISLVFGISEYRGVPK